MVFRKNSCPKCKGDVWLDIDEYGWYEQCVICDYLCSLEGVKYINGVERIVVSREETPQLYSFRSLIETLRAVMKARVDEAKACIVVELSKEALDRRQLKSRMRGMGIIKYAFDNALEQLKKAGVVTAQAAGSGNRKKLSLLISSQS